MNGRKNACYLIENIGFEIDLLLREMVFFQPEVLHNGQKFEAQGNINMMSMV